VSATAPAPWRGHGPLRPVQTAQRWLGIVILAAFAATGWVMLLHHPAMEGLPPVTRLQMRSGHIFLMFSGALNLLLSLLPPPRRRASRLRRSAALAGSLLVMAAAVQLLAGFFLESSRGVLDRPLTTTALVESFVGTLLAFLATPRRESETTGG
jgi:hypothetical protein